MHPSRCRSLAALLGLVTFTLAGCSAGESRDTASPGSSTGAARSLGDAAAPLGLGPESATNNPRGASKAAATTAGAATPPRPSAAADGRAPTSASRVAAGPRKIVLGRIDLTGIGHDRGSPRAPVVVIDLSDFACPYCAKFSQETYPAIEREYVATGKVFFKYLPFIAGGFPHSREASRAVECAAEQGGFWRMMDLIYEAQSEWKRARDPYPLLSGIADIAGVDSAAVGACYRSGRTDARTERASSVANDLGVRVTPSFIVNGRPIQGALPLADFRKVLNAALLVSSADR